MLLYHFCATRHADSIQKHGIRPGALPVARGGVVVVLRGWTWLTSSPSWMQPWDVQVHVPYSRAAVRFDVTVPDDERTVRWLDLRDTLGADYGWLETFDGVGGAEEWWLYRGGIIPPEWLSNRTMRP